MIEMFKDRNMQKSLLISLGIMTLLAFELVGLSNVYPLEWLNILAWVIFFGFIFVFFTFILGFIIYAQLYDDY